MQQRNDHNTTNCITVLFFSREISIYVYGREGTEACFADKLLAFKLVVTVVILVTPCYK